MRSFFPLILFISATILIESPHCVADGDFYEQIRKKKNPSPAEIDAIRKKTIDESRRESVNKISAESRDDAIEANKLPKETDTSDKDDKDDVPVVAPKAKPKPTSRPESVSRPSNSTATKSDPGSYDELEFPGEPSPTPKPKKKN